MKVSRTRVGIVRMWGDDLAVDRSKDITRMVNGMVNGTDSDKECILY
jgi:hypothetical protein